MKVDVFLKSCPFPEDNVFFRRFRSSFQTGFQVVIRRDDEGRFAVCPEGLRSNFSDQKLERLKNKKYRIRIRDLGSRFPVPYFFELVTTGFCVFLG
jgi:hypothetical protein